MRRLLLVVVLMLIAARTVSAHDHHKPWIKYFAGTWTITGDGAGGQLAIKAIGDGVAGIGVGKDADGRESAWILGWNLAENRLVHEYYADHEHCRASYEIVDEETLLGSGEVRDRSGIIKGTITITKEDTGRYTVQWTDVTLNGEKTPDMKFVVEKEK